MSAKKILPYIITILSFVTAVGHSQIITSKKEAVKKGIYQKPSEIKKTDIVVDKSTKPVVTTTTPKAVAATTPKPVATKPAKPGSKSKYIVDNVDDSDLLPSAEENYLALQLINNAMSFVGVKYHGGGTTTSGMDCSGMVTAVFNIFDLKLPRSSTEMSKVGEKRDSGDVHKGDLIFFKTNGKRVINHVGMVVEVLNDEIKFIHSSSSEGVKISSTKEPYYKKTFAQVNKVLQQ